MSKDFELDLSDILEDFSTEVRENIEKASKETTKEMVKELKATSPKKTGKYAKSWRYKAITTFNGKTYVIYNSKGQLTHLLENGHALKNGGRTKAFPHIKPVEEKAKRVFEMKVRDQIG